jgi:hypothetical protein
VTGIFPLAEMKFYVIVRLVLNSLSATGGIIHYDEKLISFSTHALNCVWSSALRSQLMIVIKHGRTVEPIKMCL